MAARCKCYQLPLADDEFIVFSNHLSFFVVDLLNQVAVSLSKSYTHTNLVYYRSMCSILRCFEVLRW